MVVDRVVSTYNLPKEEVLRWYRNEIQSIDGMAQLANRLAKDFPQLDVIFRPHPEESLETYRGKLSPLPNIHLTKSGPVWPWILNTAAVIQRSCTTAIEASLAGRSAISPQWISPSNFYPVPESVSLQCADYDSLRDVVQAHLDGQFRLPNELLQNIAEVVEKWFYKMDGLAHKRVADAILSSLSTATQPNRKKCLKELYKVSGARSLRTLPNLIRYTLGLAPEWSFRRRTAFYHLEFDEYFNLQAITDLVRAIGVAKADESKRRVNVSLANDGGAYLMPEYRGRAVIMEAA
jgi:hypothetical protein